MGYGQSTRLRFYSSWYYTFCVRLAAKCYDCADKRVNLQKASGKSQYHIHRLYLLLSALGICIHIHVYIFVRHKWTLIGLRYHQFTLEVVLVEGRRWYSPLTTYNESEEMLLVSQHAVIADNDIYVAGQPSIDLSRVVDPSVQCHCRIRPCLPVKRQRLVLWSS